MPYINKIDNIFEIYNELTILVISLLLFPFSDCFDLDAELRFNIGWFIDILTVLLIVINLLNVLIQMIISVFQTIKALILKYKR